MARFVAFNASALVGALCCLDGGLGGLGVCRHSVARALVEVPCGCAVLATAQAHII